MSRAEESKARTAFWKEASFKFSLSKVLDTSFKIDNLVYHIKRNEKKKNHKKY